MTEGREIPYHIGESFAERHNMHFIETSAKESANVEKIFYDIAEQLTKQANELHAGPRQGATKLNEKDLETSKIGNCCLNLWAWNPNRSFFLVVLIYHTIYILNMMLSIFEVLYVLYMSLLESILFDTLSSFYFLF